MIEEEKPAPPGSQGNLEQTSADTTGVILSPEGTSTAASPDSSWRRFGPRPFGGGGRVSWFERYAGLGILVAMIVFLSLTLPDLFPTYDNVVGILANETISTIVSLGLLIPLAAGVFDISIAGMTTMAVVMVTALFQYTSGAVPIWAAILLTLCAGFIVGAVNGLLVVVVRVDPFIATIGTGSILIGLSQLVANGETLSFHIPPAFTQIGRAKVAGVPITVAYALVLALLVWYVLRYTPLGRMLYATGAGREAARLSGVRTERIIFLAFMASACFATVAGVVLASRLGSGPPDLGSGYLLPAFAACFLGSTIIDPGRFNVGGLIVAILIVAVGINGLQLNGIPFWVVETFQGTALIVAVVFAQLRRTRAR
jgi:ribose transport system permease protein